MTGSSLRGVLLDVDGTLIDSNEAHARSWSDTLREFGRDVPPGRVKPLVGMGGDKLLPMLLEVEAESERGRAFSERRAEVFRQHHVPHLRQTPGAAALLERLRAEGLRLVIATSAREEELEVMLRQVGLDDLVQRRTSSDDADHSKPDPDIVQAALARAGLHADQALMLGDTPYDVEAAARAGVGTVALLTGGWQPEDLRGALAVYRDPADLLHQFTASPFASGAPYRRR